MEIRKNLIKILFLFFLLLVFKTFLVTLHPVFKNNDSPETSVAAYVLGIGHPPGYPLFTLCAKIFSIIPVANPGFRTNLFSSFLAILVLLMIYFFINKFVLNITISLLVKYSILYISFTIFAFSFLFWNQSIEAKGGIYILNLLFFIILSYLGLRLITDFEIKYFYLFVYTYGLSLTNHWPSMIIFLPLILFLFYKFFERIKYNLFLILFFFVVGISPYLFLFIRAKTDPVLNWGNPSTPDNLLWVILRKGYVYPIKAGFNVIVYQTKEFFRLFFENYSFFWILSITGVISLFKKNKKFFYYYISIFLIVVFAVVIYNRTKEELLWQMDIFLLPAEFIIFIFIIYGLYEFFVWHINKIIKSLIFLLIIVLIIFQVFYNFQKNNNSRNFLLYDYGSNILLTLEKNACYIGDGDYNLMPIYYLQSIQKKREDIKFITSSFLIFKWGIDDFIRHYGFINLKPFDTNNNLKKIIEFYVDKNAVYISNYFPRINEMDIKFYKNQKGLLINLSRKEKAFGSGIYDLYSYRGVFEKFCLLNKINTDLIGWYPASMVNQANKIVTKGKIDDAIKLYKKSLLFKIDKPVDIIYYNLALAYKEKKDLYNQLIYLLKAAEKTKEFTIINEAIILCYYIGWLTKVEELLEKLRKDNFVLDNKLQEIKNIVSKLKNNDKYEIMLIKANEFINGQNFKIAELIYQNLLEKNYKISIIYRNLGVYYFKTNELNKAELYFRMSQSETQNPEIYTYIAFTQYKLGKKQEALKTVKQGLELFSSDKQLNELYLNLQKEVSNK